GPTCGNRLAAALGLERCCLFFDRGEQRGPGRGEGACSVALELLGEGVGVDAGVGGRGGGSFRGRGVGLQPLVGGSVVGEGEQRLLRDGVDRVRGGQPAEIVGVGKVRVLGRGGCPQYPLRAGARFGERLPALVREQLHVGRVGFLRHRQPQAA